MFEIVLINCCILPPLSRQALVTPHDSAATYSTNRDASHQRLIAYPRFLINLSTGGNDGQRGLSNLLDNTCVLITICWSLFCVIKLPLGLNMSLIT